MREKEFKRTKHSLLKKLAAFALLVGTRVDVRNACDEKCVAAALLKELAKGPLNVVYICSCPGRGAIRFVVSGVGC